ncbi:hypothetical protein [Nocardioides panacisoli]
MTRLQRPATALGAAALLALSLTACGGSDDDSSSGSSDSTSAASDSTDAGGDVADAPADASKDDFCGAWNDVFDVLASTTTPDETAFGKFQDAVAHLGEVGTPAEVSADQRKGFEVFVDAIGNASYADVTKSDSDSLPGVSADEETQAEQFVQWAATEECASVPSGAPTAVPSPS